MFALQSLFLKGAIIERVRIMSVSARLLVRKGQTVRAVDPIAEDVVYPEHVFIDAVRGLGVSQDRVESLMQCKPGMRVQSGDLLAGPIGFPKRVIRAPKNGKVLYTGKGQILIGLEESCKQLLAGYPGEVVELITDRGVRIRTHGSLVQGVWGNGIIGEGEIELLPTSGETGITHRDLKSNHKGKVIVSEYCNDPPLFDRAIETGLKGLVFASLDPLVVRKAAEALIPVLIIEGFGEKPMNKRAQQILQDSRGKIATINAEPWDHRAGTRPEVVIPTTVMGDLTSLEDFQFYEPGKSVRVISFTGQNRCGILIDFVGRVRFPGGFYADAAKVKFEDITMIVPLLNIELISESEDFTDD